MKKLNKKGFTLIELLAVIVLLAIVAVFVGSNVITRMNGARSDAGASTYNIISKEVKSRMVLNQSNITCDDADACKAADYEFNSNEYGLVIANGASGGYTITLTVTSGINDASACKKKVVDGAICNTTDNTIVGTVK